MRLVGFIRANPIATCVLLVVVASAIFIAFPGIDLAVSDLFHRPRPGFWMKRSDVLGIFRRSNDILVTIVTVALIASIAVKLARLERPSPVAPNIVVYLLSTALLGPVLLVNVILKDNWGRPRPVQVDLFGGAAPYVEVWRITDWCDENCSFVAGEAAAAMWLVLVVMVLPKSVRAPAIMATLVYVLLVSLNRIAFGGHFLSDVVIAFGLTLLAGATVHRFVIERPPKWLTSEALEAALTRLGRAVRGETSRATAA